MKYKVFKGESTIPFSYWDIFYKIETDYYYSFRDKGLAHCEFEPAISNGFFYWYLNGKIFGYSL